MPAIRCCGLTKRYGPRTVVDALDLDVAEGELFGFVGPNGAGKTTTARMLLGLIRPDAGEAWLLGCRVPCPQRLGSIGALLEEPAFYPWMTGRRNLEVIAAEGRPLHPKTISAALEQVGMATAGDRKVRVYSQGMRQRLGLATALLRRPSVMLLDEPANGLDPAGIRELRSLLRRLTGTGTTVFLSSHLLGEVEAVCDRVGVIDRGRLVGVLTVNEPEGNRVRVRVQPAETGPARAALSAWTVAAGSTGELTVDGARARDVNQALAAAGIFAEALTTERLDLEHRFLALTEGGQNRGPIEGLTDGGQRHGSTEGLTEGGQRHGSTEGLTEGGQRHGSTEG